MVSVLQVSLLVSVAVMGAGARRVPSYYSGEQHRDEGGVPSPFLPVSRVPHGYQFSSFRGPVSGSIEEISVPYVAPYVPHSHYPPDPNHPSTSVDYVAKPDYAFTFGVQDPESGNAQARQETREGDTVQGEYSVMEPDGTLRTVIYSADPINGFQARVKYGPSGLPPPPPPTPSPTTGYTGPQETPQYRHKPDNKAPEKSRYRPSKPKRPAYSSYDEEEEY